LSPRIEGYLSGRFAMKSCQNGLISFTLSAWLSAFNILRAAEWIFMKFLFYPEEGGSMFLRNFSNVIPDNTASYSWQWGVLRQFVDTFQVCLKLLKNLGCLS
jgi:hypothetical protein